MNSARKAGDLSYSVGAVDPEIDGYNGKTWNSHGAALDESGGSPSSSWGVRASQVGGPRESTRGMGNTTTQTERGYDNPEWNVAPGLRISQRQKLQKGDLATGGEITHIGDGANVSPRMQKWLAAGGRAILGTVIPGASVGFTAARQLWPDRNPAENTAWETFIGRKPITLEGPMTQDQLPSRLRRRNRDNG